MRKISPIDGVIVTVVVSVSVIVVVVVVVGSMTTKWIQSILST